jgi:Domain of unknown function (DUF4377)
MRLNRVLLLLALALLPACSAAGNATGVENDRITLYVAHYTRTCTGLIETECMLVREDPNGEWENFYGGIEGFTYEPGYSYKLLVATRRIPNPPADGSSIEYRLVQIIEQVRTRGGP